MNRKIRIALIGLLFLILVLGLAGCSIGVENGDTDDGSYNEMQQTHYVTFLYGEGDSYTVPVFHGEKVDYMEAPDYGTKIFQGWYVDASYRYRYDFSKPVVTDMELYAKYSIDYAALTNTITTETMHGIVKVNVEQYQPKKFLGITIGKDRDSQKASQGSGVVFYLNDSFALILTNCHVAHQYGGYSYYESIVTDCKGNTFEASLYRSVNKSETAIDADYDLAVLYVDLEGKAHEFIQIDIAGQNPIEGAVAVSVGTPDGQQNALAFGTVTDYGQITLSNTPLEASNVTFDVLYHNAFTQPGSSGGAILDESCRLIGIHYAGSMNNDYHGYAIPIEKVREFLDRYVYN